MASRYAWVITKDNIGGGAEGVIGPRGATLTAKEIRRDGQMFQMFDADGEFYYAGYLTGKYSGFEPLDDYGEPNAGATEIRYRGGVPGTMWGKWEAI